VVAGDEVPVVVAPWRRGWDSREVGAAGVVGMVVGRERGEVSGASGRTDVGGVAGLSKETERAVGAGEVVGAALSTTDRVNARRVVGMVA
jgi:hypothetical protein